MPRSARRVLRGLQADETAEVIEEGTPRLLRAHATLDEHFWDEADRDRHERVIGAVLIDVYAERPTLAGGDVHVRNVRVVCFNGVHRGAREDMVVQAVHVFSAVCGAIFS